MGTTFLLLVIIALVEQITSFLFWGIFWIALGVCVISVSVNKRERSASVILYFIFFTSYLLYSYICNLFYVKNPEVHYFYALDSTFYFSYSNMLGSLQSLNEVIYTSFTDFYSIENPGFSVISGCVAFFSNYWDGNNILVQKLIVVFFSAMIPPILFNIFLNYFDSAKAFKFTLLYGCLSYAFFYSAVFIRDVPIGFFFLFIIYLFHLRFNLRRVTLFLVFSLLIFFFRAEHGVFSLLFLLAYLYTYLRESSSKFKYVTIFAVSLLCVLLLADQVASFYNLIDSTTSRYFLHSVNDADSQSLGLALLKLPWGVRHIIAGLFSQIIPFPFYVSYEHGLGFIPLSIASIFWFFVWVVLIRSFFDRELRILLDRRLSLLLLIASVLVIGNYVNVDTRRIMAVYPIFFTVSMIFFDAMSRTVRFKVVLHAAVYYIVLLLTYWFIKGSF